MEKAWFKSTPREKNHFYAFIPNPQQRTVHSQEATTNYSVAHRKQKSDFKTFTQPQNIRQEQNNTHNRVVVRSLLSFWCGPGRKWASDVKRLTQYKNTHTHIHKVRCVFLSMSTTLVRPKSPSTHSQTRTKAAGRCDSSPRVDGPATLPHKPTHCDRTLLL